MCVCVWCVQSTTNARQGLAVALQGRAVRRGRVHRQPGASLSQDVGTAREGRADRPPHRNSGAVQLSTSLARTRPTYLLTYIHRDLSSQSSVGSGYDVWTSADIFLPCTKQQASLTLLSWRRVFHALAADKSPKPIVIKFVLATDVREVNSQRDQLRGIRVVRGKSLRFPSWLAFSSVYSDRVPTPPGKSWIFSWKFQDLESPGKSPWSWKVLENIFESHAFF